MSEPGQLSGAFVFEGVAELLVEDVELATTIEEVAVPLVLTVDESATELELLVELLVPFNCNLYRLKPLLPPQISDVSALQAAEQRPSVAGTEAAFSVLPQ